MYRPRLRLYSCRVQVEPIVPSTVASALKKFGNINKARSGDATHPRPSTMTPFTRGSLGLVTSCWLVSGAESRLFPLDQYKTPGRRGSLHPKAKFTLSVGPQM